MLSAFNAKALASIGVWMGRGRGAQFPVDLPVEGAARACRHVMLRCTVRESDKRHRLPPQPVR
jgi:hypothetical protein